MTLYITGITGHSGKWFMKRLVSEGYKGKIRCLIRSNKPPLLECDNLEIEFITGDIRDFNLLQDSMVGVDVVIHIASISLSENVIEAAITNNVKWAILVHTTGRFSKFKSASGGYIRIEDGIIEKRDKLDITIVRPTMIYGSSRDGNMYKLVDFLYRKKFFPLFGNGINLMRPVHAKDLGNAYFDILNNPEITKNKEYDLSGKEPIEYIEIIKTISRAMNRKNVIIKLPIWFSVISARIYNFVSSNAKITVEQVMRMQEDKAFGHELATKDFGYNPLSFEEGIQGEVEEYFEKVRGLR